jgi:prepilin-type N-terminal cleavage/methylation domain-containing protein
MTGWRSESGFSLIEMLVATGLLLVVSSIVTTALLQMTDSQKTIWNRTEMHSGIRGATELLQQEVGQAGRITLPRRVTLNAAVTGVSSCVTPVTVTVSAAAGTATAGMFVSESLTVLDGDNQESVSITAIPSATQITACFTRSHASGAVLAPLGGFATGILPPTGIAHGSSATVLKMYGDINGDGNMVYVEYTCDTIAHNLYRNVMAFDAVPPKPLVTDSQILLSNIIDNPGTPPTPCFTYQTSTITIDTVPPTPFTFVLDVAVTLTVQTQQVDPVTKAYQTETKALLNVSPRNVFNAWAMAGIGYTDRIQSTPVSVTTLLP